MKVRKERRNARMIEGMRRMKELMYRMKEEMR